MTPSAISQRIRALESAAGQVLVQRSTPCRATPAGETLLRLARQIRLLHDEAEQTLAGEIQEVVDLPVAVNADSLATWLRPVLKEVAAWEGAALRLHVEDQAFSADLLRTWRGAGRCDLRPSPVQGCVVERLGTLRYTPAAAPTFAERWRRGRGYDWSAMPAVVFNEKDALQHDVLDGARGVRAAGRAPGADVARLPRGRASRARLGDHPRAAAASGPRGRAARRARASGPRRRRAALAALAARLTRARPPDRAGTPSGPRRAQAS